MTDAELCAAVARAMGHRVHGIIDGACIIDLAVGGEPSGMRIDFDPIGNPEDAWELQERLSEMGYQVHYTSPGCCLLRKGASVFRGVDVGRDNARALCLAAVEAGK